MQPYTYILADSQFIVEEGSFLSKDFESAEAELLNRFGQLKDHSIWFTCFATGRNGIVRLKTETENG